MFVMVLVEVDGSSRFLTSHRLEGVRGWGEVGGAGCGVPPGAGSTRTHGEVAGGRRWCR